MNSAQKMDQLIESLSKEDITVKLYMSLRICYMGLLRNESINLVTSDKCIFSKLTLKTHTLEEILEDLVDKYEKQDFKHC